ncbi:MAG: uroporphyrinogen-III synthase [Pseudomonadota bacterium]|nr:uroporphyrinogen-III synthase [Pseudomonadota bacterium]
MSAQGASLPLPVLILRPQPGAQASLEAARKLGLAAEAYPLFEVRPQAWEAPACDDIDAIVLGSANALRHGGGTLEAYRGKPAYAVGQKTAEAARAAGLDVVCTGRGGLQSVLNTLAPEHRRLLRLAGRERVALHLPEGVTMTTREVYASEALPAPEALRQRLCDMSQGAVLVLLHSGEAAVRFEDLCREWGLATGAIHLVAIGPRVSARLHSPWGSVRCAPEPSDAALLALAAQMCQEAFSGSIQVDNQT